MTKFLKFKSDKKIWKKSNGLEYSVSIKFDEITRKLDITTNVQSTTKSWGVGSGIDFEPDEYLALVELLKNVKVV